MIIDKRKAKLWKQPKKANNSKIISLLMYLHKEQAVNLKRMLVEWKTILIH